MRTKLYILLPICLILLAACEKEIEFKAPDVEAASDVAINAIAIEGEPLRVFLNKAYSVGQAPLLNIGYEYALSKNDALVDYQTDDYYKRTAIRDAEVQAIVNGQQTYTLALDSASSSYFCDYRPRVGDRIEVQAEGLHVETIVPPSPKIEILSHEVLAENPYKLSNGLSFETDTIMRITCRIPSSNTNQYYRLRVRGERKMVIDGNWFWGDRHELRYAYYLLQDIYFSEEELFVDSRLTSGFGGWPAYFSDIFDKSAILRGDNTISIDSPKPKGYYGSNDYFMWKDKIIQDIVHEPDVPARVMVELQALSPELYHYLKSVELFRITESDAFSEPVQIYSNVQNGWGIFGALSYDRHFVEYGE